MDAGGQRLRPKGLCDATTLETKVHAQVKEQDETGQVMSATFQTSEGGGSRLLGQRMAKTAGVVEYGSTAKGGGYVGCRRAEPEEAKDM